MEDGRRRRLGKSPAVPFRHSPPPFKVMASSTLSREMEMEMDVPSSNYNSNVMISNSSQEATGNITFSSSETNMVDLNIPLPLVEIDHVDDQSSDHVVSPFNCYLRPPPSPCRTRQQISALDQALEKELKKNGPTSDLRKLRRTVSNRLSAQRSRTKKAQHITDLEQKIIELQDMIAILSPRIENYKSKRGALLIQKATLEKQLHDCMTISNLCNVEIEKNKREVQRLKELQKKQREQMLFAVSNFGMQGSPCLHHHHHQHPQQLLSSTSFRHHFEESNHIDPTVVDQYINFDALN